MLAARRRRRRRLARRRARARPARARARRRRRAGAPRGCPSTRRCCATASSACCSSPATSTTLAAQLERLDPRRRAAARGSRERVRGARDEPRLGARGRRGFEAIYARARRAPPRRRRATRELRARLRRARADRRRPAHAHRPLAATARRRSTCCSPPPRERGLGAIAVTDHNEISGALEARAKAAEYGIKVIVAEEVKTADQGEVIGLFIEEKIPRGMTLEETIAEIQRQGGLVYVPHPFDRMHSVPDYEHLLAVVEDIDAIEVFNPRVAIPAFNEEAVRFAAKYRIVGGAGSDAHVAAGPRLGADPDARLRRAGGVPRVAARRRHRRASRRRCSTVQALKFLQTKATPPAARRRRARERQGPRGRVAAQSMMQGQGEPGAAAKPARRNAGHRRRDPREVPRARDPRAQPRSPASCRAATAARAAT